MRNRFFVAACSFNQRIRTRRRALGTSQPCLHFRGTTRSPRIVDQIPVSPISESSYAPQVDALQFSRIRCSGVGLLDAELRDGKCSTPVQILSVDGGLRCDRNSKHSGECHMASCISQPAGQYACQLSGLSNYWASRRICKATKNQICTVAKPRGRTRVLRSDQTGLLTKDNLVQETVRRRIRCMGVRPNKRRRAGLRCFVTQPNKACVNANFRMRSRRAANCRSIPHRHADD